MSKDENGDGLAYCHDEGDVSLYEMWLDDRVVMRVFVDTSDSKLPVTIARPNAESPIFETGLHARMRLRWKKLGGKNVSFVQHVDSAYLQRVVYSRLPWLIANCYAPGGKQVTT